MTARRVMLRVAAKELGDVIDSACACGSDTPGRQGTRAVAEQDAVMEAANKLSSVNGA